MDYTHLNDEEMGYELALRHVVNLGPTTHRGKVIRLKALLQEESLRGNRPVSSEHVMSAQANIEICQLQAEQLHLLTETAVNSGDINGLNNLRSRLSHYQNRLRLINPPVELKDTHTLVTMHVNVLFNKVVSVLRYSVNGVQEEEEAANQQQNSTGAIRRTGVREQGASGGNNISANSVEHAQEQEETPPTASSMPRMQSFSGGRGQGLLFPMHRKNILEIGVIGDHNRIIGMVHHHHLTTSTSTRPGRPRPGQQKKEQCEPEKPKRGKRESGKPKRVPEKPKHEKREQGTRKPGMLEAEKHKQGKNTKGFGTIC